MTSVLAAAGAHACNASFFACSDAKECAGDNGSGICEPTGWCSFPDESCASGSRYGGLAGDGLADECVAPAGTESTGDATTIVDPSVTTFTTADPVTETSSPTSTSTTEESSESGAPSMCGDGDLDDDEACDDGNLSPADGCSPQCQPSGSLLWQQSIGGDPGSASALALWQDGDVMVGFTVVLDTGAMPGVWRVEPERGDIVWTEGLAPPNDEIASVTDIDVRVLGDTEDAIVSVAAVGMTTGDSVIYRVTDDGASSTLEMADGHVVFGLAREPGGRGMAVGINAFGNGFVQQFDAQGEFGVEQLGEPYLPNDGAPLDVLLDGDVTYVVGLQFSDPTIPAFFGATVNEVALRHQFVPGLDNRAQAIARDPRSGRLWIGGVSTDFGGWVATVNPSGIELEPELVTGGGGGQVVAVAVDPDGSAVVVGADGREGDRNGRVVRIDPSGAVRWSGSYPTEGDDILLDVAIAGTGELFVAGTRVVDDVAVAWFARLVP